MQKEREELTKLQSLFEAKKEEHLREERKVRNFEIADTKQKDMIKQKEMAIKVNEDKLRALNDEATELNKEIY